jgi:hypothetical protein
MGGPAMPPEEGSPWSRAFLSFGLAAAGIVAMLQKHAP